MSLLKRDREKRIAAKKEFAERHPILRMSADRNVRNAYLHGLVFAAAANDDRIDDVECEWINKLGVSLGFNAEDVDEAICELEVANDDTKMSLIEECARQLTDVGVAECFLKQFEELWTLGGGGAEEFEQFEPQLVEWMGDDVKSAIAEAKREAAERERQVAAERMIAMQSELAARLVEIIEGDDTWPVEFKPCDNEKLFREAGVEDIQAFVVNSLLPKFKHAFELAKDKIREAKIVHDSNDDDYNGVKFESVREFRILFRYAFFFDAYLDLVPACQDYYFCGPSDCDSDYYMIGSLFSSLIGSRTHLSAERRRKTSWPSVEGFANLTRVTLDRLRCHYFVWDDEAEEYFSQWMRLFAGIEKLLPARRADPARHGTAG